MNFLIKENDTLLTQSQNATPKTCGPSGPVKGMPYVAGRNLHGNLRRMLGGRLALQAGSQSFKVNDELPTG